VEGFLDKGGLREATRTMAVFSTMKWEWVKGFNKGRWIIQSMRHGARDGVIPIDDGGIVEFFLHRYPETTHNRVFSPSLGDEVDLLLFQGIPHRKLRVLIYKDSFYQMGSAARICH
jgi:hypothetical protein